ncbi:hypothetical protein ARMSODRAFT_471140 [Armillaria solidipes]|uniref:Uncharacterized protein n=1 Tax=Armillaria solidipes TaxID=1076256 RepID=A0A2H3B0F3_9AGAR|nr:hypothetical protein ARMSODRAFT_471140 [Armillaria solidipes]
MAGLWTRPFLIGILCRYQYHKTVFSLCGGSLLMPIFPRAGIQDSLFACLAWCLTLSILLILRHGFSKEGTSHTNRRQSRFTSDANGIEPLMVSEMLIEERRSLGNGHVAWKLKFRGSIIDNLAGGRRGWGQLARICVVLGEECHQPSRNGRLTVKIANMLSCLDIFRIDHSSVDRRKDDNG